MREQLRTFHLSGKGLDELRPTSPMRPVLPEEVLKALPPAESFQPEPLASLHASALAAERAPARAKFLAALKQAVAQLQDLLSVDDAKRTPAGAGHISASLGAEAGRFLAVDELTGAWKRPASPVMDDTRRGRCAASLAVLEQALAAARPESIVFSHDGASADALAASHRQLDEAAPVLRAMRVAALEALGSYDAATHDEVLARFDWQTAEPWEIAALPSIVVLETPERLAQASLTAFSKLLRSGRPVQILVSADGLSIDDLSGSVTDIGTLALAHRGAFVLQSSVAVREHLTQGLGEMARTLRPAVAVVSVANSKQDWLETSLLAHSKAFPLFRYDPDREGGWWQRFALAEPGAAFETVTPLDALTVRFAPQFRAIPGKAEKDQLELREYFKQYKTAPPQVIPFLNAVDAAGHPHRLAVTRELVHIGFDRLRAWEMLAALTVAPVEPKAVEASAALTIREDAAKDAYKQVLAMLADPALISPAAR